MALNKKKFDFGGAGSTGNMRLITYYNTADTRATIVGAGYFNGAAALMRTGDVMILGGSDKFGMYSVGVAAGVVTLTVVVAPA